MEYRDYYKILGVDRNANEQEIKRAYRKLAREFHPDLNPGDKGAEEKFKEINEANEVLTDSDKRGKYDQLGSSWRHWQNAGGDPGQFDWSQWFGSEPGGGGFQWSGDLGDVFGKGGSGSFSDFFSVIFGDTAGSGRTQTVEDLFRRTGSRNSRAKRGAETIFEITLQEAFRGTTRLLERGGRRIRMRIPPGARTGSKIRVPGTSSTSGGGPSSDLYLKIKVKGHPDFERDGNDLRRKVSVDLYTAVLGGETRVQTLDGEVALKIPAGTSSGRTFRLRGKGMPNPRARGDVGDMFVTVQVVVPESLGERERELFQELARLRADRQTI
ncbi:MAG: DnaJ domain-containing protein [Anaerolineae bacterium]|nr:DnaJ domain-containing protein [Anaerolineae bacterium]